MPANANRLAERLEKAAEFWIDPHAYNSETLCDLLREAAAALRPQPCGHPQSLLIKSVESDHQFCELCEATSRYRDAEQREQDLTAEVAALRQQQGVESELAHLRIVRDRLVAQLSHIHAFLSPHDVKLPDGRVFEFNNPAIEHEMLRGLSQAIRQTPTAIADALSEPAAPQRIPGDSPERGPWPEGAGQTIDAMVDRFLAWRLPATFSPDCGISFNKDVNGGQRDPDSHWWPVGTNLFSAAEARQMIEHVLSGDQPEDHPYAHPRSDIVWWLQSWWTCGDTERERKLAAYGPDVAHMLRGVADMIEPQPDKGLEDAAKVCDEIARAHYGHADMAEDVHSRCTAESWGNAAVECAKRIRALAAAPAKEK